MKSVSLRRIAEVTGGFLDGPGRLRVSGVGIDSREIGDGDLFVALEGERNDGHSFLDDARLAGARAAMVERGNRYAEEFRRRGGELPLIAVEDTLEAMGGLAAHVRDCLDIEAIGVTGTTGKTCTKDFLASCLGISYRVAASPGSYNNEIGTPLTVFSVKSGDQVLITEMGARHPGDIKALARIVKPRRGIITNIGPGHLELFGSPQAVARTKGELAAALPRDGTLFLNADDNWTRQVARRTSARVVKFGYSRSAAYRATGVRLDERGYPAFTLHGPGFDVEVGIQAVGGHQVTNALAAAACAREMGLDPEAIAAGLRRARLSRWRMDARQAPGGYLVINDAYNANPQSMRAALQTLAAMGEKRRTIAVLGPMAELGAGSGEYHLEAGREVVSLDVDLLVAIGKDAKGYAVAALAGGLPRGSVFCCQSAGDAACILGDIVEPGDVVLVKASRVMGLESLAQELASNGFAREKMVADV
ncbi:MAG: UDP-N-acetylmuramoyl-tripeptide--D-alanyl-D-alanine ligase [Actinobacteria bacterium]|nr:UDP-N-acetylmuramoyl-tripeptide--D-alanyl-D-alanine ligase [Actinomycetota bacterium]